MSDVEKTYNITLKVAMTESGGFKSVRLLKGRSKMKDELLELLNKALNDSLVPSLPVRTTVEIGNDSEQMIMNYLRSISMVNSDFTVEDMSSVKNHGDIAVTHGDKRFCIEIKAYTKPVPIKEVEKAHKSLAHVEYDAGIMIQMNPCGYYVGANISTPIDVQMVSGKPMAYLTAPDLALIYPIIRMLITTMVDSEMVDNSNATKLNEMRKRLSSIGENVNAIRSVIDTHKKNIDRLEGLVNTVATLSLSP